MSEPRMLSDEEFASYVADLKRQGFYHFPDRLIADRKARKEELARYKEIARAAREFDRKWFAAEVAASAINALHSALSRLPEPIEEEQECTIYQTTWTTQHDTGPMAGEVGPDLAKPCARCGRSVKDHARMSLEPPTEEEQE